MNRLHKDLDALKANICDKKKWIADFAVKQKITSQEKAEIENELSRLVTNSSPIDMFDVMLQLDIYASGLQNIIWELCNRHEITPPACSYFTLSKKGN